MPCPQALSQQEWQLDSFLRNRRGKPGVVIIDNILGNLESGSTALPKLNDIWKNHEHQQRSVCKCEADLQSCTGAVGQWSFWTSQGQSAGPPTQ
jgi:hypothetical protein